MAHTNKNSVPQKDTFEYIQTLPQEGPENFFVKCFLKGKYRFFFINKKGEFLNPANWHIWENAIKTWEPKVEVKPLPKELHAKAIKISGLIGQAIAKKVGVSEYVKSKIDQKTTPVVKNIPHSGGIKIGEVLKETEPETFARWNKEIQRQLRRPA